MTPHDVDVLLYDLGGVVLGIDFDRTFAHWSRHSGLPAETIKARFHHDAQFHAHECGRLDAPGFYDWVRRTVGFDLDDRTLQEGWIALLGSEIAPTVEAIRKLEGRIPQYVFSNTNVEHEDVWVPRLRQALAPMRGIFTSCRIGLRKPDAEAFHHVAREIGVPPRRILFFDDTPHNVEGARAAGLQAVHVRSPEDVLGAVRPWM